MTQDRRITDKLPTEPLVWDADQKLIDAALQHLADEKTRASIVEVPDSVPALVVAVGTKPALRGLLSDDGADTATPSPAKVDLTADARKAINSAAECVESYGRDDLAEKLRALLVSAAAAQEPSDLRKALEAILTAEGDEEEYEAMVKARALLDAAPVAAQAAVPEGWAVERVGDAMHIKRADGKWCGYMVENGPAAALTFSFLSDLLAAAPEVPPAEPAAEQTFWKSQRKMIERAIIGLRDGWATRKDADDALAALAALAASPAEPAPIQTSALTDERIIEICAKHWLGATIGLAVGRAIEREVLARLSTPTAEGTASDAAAYLVRWEGNGEGSVFRHEVVAEAIAKNNNGSYAPLYEHRHIAAQAPAGRDAIRDQALEEAARHFEQEVFDQNKVRMVTSEIRALKSASPAESKSQGGE